MHRLPQFRYWIFDLDGTLTKPVHNFDEIRLALGIPANQDILTFIEAQSPDRKQALNHELIAIEEQLAAKAEVNSGVIDWLSYLQTQNCRLGILTRNKRHCVDIALAKIGCAQFFHPQAIVASETAAPKPNPAGVNYLLSLWQAPVSSAVIMGDYRFDLEAGKAANISTIHFAPEGAPLWQESTDIRVRSFLELLNSTPQGAL